MTASNNTTNTNTTTTSSNASDVKKDDVVLSSGSSEGGFSSGGGSGGGGGQPAIDEKKRKRMDSNRESAKRSRLKKQQHLEGLINQVSHLSRFNVEINERIDEISGKFGEQELQNKVLKQQKDNLETKLNSLESILKTVKGDEEKSGLINLNIECDDPMMKPWQLPTPASLPIYAAADGCRNFKF